MPDWLSEKLNIPATDIARLGEGYFPSAAVMPGRVFPFVVLGYSDTMENTCGFIPLKQAFENINVFEELHTMVAIMRVVHAMDLWSEYLQKPQTNFSYLNSI